MTIRELFDFITDTSITSLNMEQYLEKVGRTQQNLQYSWWKMVWVLFVGKMTGTLK